MSKNKSSSSNITLVSDEHWRKLIDRFSISTLDDVIAGKADEFTIRHYCILAAKIIHDTFCNAEIEEKKLMMLARDVFTYIGRGTDPSEAFLLKKNHRSKNDKSHDIGIALIVWCAVKDGLPTVKAIQEIAKKENLSFERVRELYYRHQSEIEKEYELILAS